MRLVLAGLLLAAPAAHADDLTLRLDAPGYAAVEGRNWFQVSGAGVTWRRGWVEADVAADFWINPCVRGFNFTARGGVAPAVAESARWSLRVPLHAGASIAPLDGDGCDANPDEQLYALTAAGGVEAVRRGARNGFSLRALGFVGEQSYEVGLLSTHPTREWRAIRGFTISLGIVLPR